MDFKRAFDGHKRTAFVALLRKALCWGLLTVEGDR